MLDPSTLTGVFNGVDVLIHLASSMFGSDEERVRSAVEGTRNVLAAFEGAGGRKVVLASSFSVYDWRGTSFAITEQSDLIADDAPDVDGYALGKVRQERLARRWATTTGRVLTVVRPCAVWGAGRLGLPQLGVWKGLDARRRWPRSPATSYLR